MSKQQDAFVIVPVKVDGEQQQASTSAQGNHTSMNLIFEVPVLTGLFSEFGDPVRDAWEGANSESSSRRDSRAIEADNWYELDHAEAGKVRVVHWANINLSQLNKIASTSTSA